MATITQKHNSHNTPKNGVCPRCGTWQDDFENTVCTFDHYVIVVGDDGRPHVGRVVEEKDFSLTIEREDGSTFRTATRLMYAVSFPGDESLLMVEPSKCAPIPHDLLYSVYHLS